MVIKLFVNFLGQPYQITERLKQQKSIVMVWRARGQNQDLDRAMF